MAKIKYDKKELEKFIGKSIPMSGLVNAFEMLGMPVDIFDKDSLAPEVTTDRVDMFTVEGAGRALSYFL